MESEVGWGSLGLGEGMGRSCFLGTGIQFGRPMGVLVPGCECARCG